MLQTEMHKNECGVGMYLFGVISIRTIGCKSESKSNCHVCVLFWFNLFRLSFVNWKRKFELEVLSREWEGAVSLIQIIIPFPLYFFVLSVVNSTCVPWNIMTTSCWLDEGWYEMMSRINRMMRIGNRTNLGTGTESSTMPSVPKHQGSSRKGVFRTTSSKLLLFSYLVLLTEFLVLANGMFPSDWTNSPERIWLYWIYIIQQLKI